jgi:hypothetical protein
LRDLLVQSCRQSADLFPLLNISQFQLCNRRFLFGDFAILLFTLVVFFEEFVE